EALEAGEKGRRAMGRVAEDGARAGASNVSKAIDAAARHFEEERRKAEAVRDAIRGGIGGDYELGSQSAQEFFAYEANARISSVVGPVTQEPTEQALLAEAQKQFAEAQRQTAIAARQERLLAELIRVTDSSRVQLIR